MSTAIIAASLAPVPGTITTNTWLVAVVALSHILIATFLTGSTTLAAVSEGIAIATGSERHERLAFLQVKAWAYVFSFGAAIAVFFVLFVLSAVWGRFYVALQQITFWVFVFEAGTFIAEVALLYALYANWHRLRPYRQVRLGMLILLNIAQWWQMFFINAVASFMLTPNNGDTSYLLQILNPTDLPLTLHRTVGNVAWAGALIALASGIQYLRVTRKREVALPAEGTEPVGALGAMPEGALVAERDRQAAFWDWAGQWGMLWAFGFTIIQPWIGYSYAKEIQLHSYDSWYSLMFGWLSTTFLIQIGLLGLILTVCTVYTWRRLRNAGNRRIARRHGVAVVIMALATLLAIQPAWLALSYDDVVAAHRTQPFWQGGLLNPVGYFFPWKVGALFAMVFTGMYVITSYVRARNADGIKPASATRSTQGWLIALGLCVMSMMIVMGVLREGSRTPYLIHGQVSIDRQEILSNPSDHTTTQQSPPS